MRLGVAGIPRGAVQVVDGVPADLEVRLVALADDECARVEQPLNHRRVAGRPPVGERADPFRVQHALDVEVILDRDRNAVERQCCPLLVVPVRRLRRRERRVPVDPFHDGVHELVHGVDPVEVRFQHLTPAHLARANVADELERAEFVQLRHLVHPRSDGSVPQVETLCPKVWNVLASEASVTATDSTRQATWSQSLERGLAILSAFGSDKSTIGVSELSRELSLSRSTTHRYIATLTSLGYLQQDAETKRYRLGPRVLDLGFAAINSMDIREISVPHLQALSDATGFTVNMAILDGPDVVYIERCRTSRSGQRQIDLNLHVGSRLPAYCTGLGKALLAFVPEERFEEILDQADLVARGPNTITDRAALRAEMERVRATGLAVNNEELAYGLRSIAAPIRARSGEVVAALNLAVHRSMVSMDDLIERYGPTVKRTADVISAEIGHRSPA